MEKIEQQCTEGSSPQCATRHERASDSNRTSSLFEFWPTWLMYLPVIIMWLVWSIRYRSTTLPLISNPRIFLSGMVGGSKAELMSQASGKCNDRMLPWIKVTKSIRSISFQVNNALKRLKQKEISYPFVCKPDTGCRGAGVKLIKDQESFIETLGKYPIGAGIILQQLASYPDEVGIFFVRQPDKPEGRIVSLTFKNRPEVIGDGHKTVCELVLQDKRAASLLSLYKSRNQSVWNSVLAKGKRHSLLFSASHCRGAVFLDGRQHITPELNDNINQIMRGLPEFHYGRMDVKFKDITSLESGEHLEIVEINGASSESIQIWDKDARLLDALKTLIWQYRTLFEIGNKIRQSGVKPPSLITLLKAWRHEQKLTSSYPEND